MVALLNAAIEGLLIFLSAKAVLFLLAGVAIGMVFGAIPGLGGIVAIALLVPLTFGMNPDPAMVLFGGALGGTAFGGSISAILINTPGTPPNAATCFDGYPLARQGRASEAIGVSATASALGAMVGLVILVLLIPVAREIILAFSSPEFFWLSVLGLAMIAVAGSGQTLKNLVAGGFGLVLASIGYSRVTGVERFVFGTNYLYDGIQLVPALIGLFAIAEVFRLATEGGTIAESDDVEDDSSALTGAISVLRRPSVLFQSAGIGTLVGTIPGVGGSVANFVSYLYTMQRSSDPDSFGTGNPDGITASEAANDAKDGGALLPTIVFGIPGSGVMVVLLGGLTIHGLQPGRQMLTDHLPTLFTLIFAVLFANIITSLVGISLADRLARLTRVSVTLLIPGILAVSLIGTFTLRNSMGDVVVMLLFGALGYAMVAFDFSRVPVVLALVLGPIAEKSFLQSRLISDTGYWIFVTRPISVVLIVLLVVTLTLPLMTGVRRIAYNVFLSRSGGQGNNGGEGPP